jgi:hypothetical protein
VLNESSTLSLRGKNMNDLTEELLALTEQPYDKYNGILREIKYLLAEPDRIEAFERVLEQELPLTTARRAFRTAIRIAMGQKNVYREWRPAEQLAKKFNSRQ